MTTYELMDELRERGKEIYSHADWWSVSVYPRGAYEYAALLVRYSPNVFIGAIGRGRTSEQALRQCLIDLKEQA